MTPIKILVFTLSLIASIFGLMIFATTFVMMTSEIINVVIIVMFTGVLSASIAFLFAELSKPGNIFGDD